MTSQEDPTYVKVNSHNFVPTLKLPNDAFVELMQKLEPPMLYVRESKADTGAMVSEFMFFHGGLMYVCSGYGYKTIADLDKAGSLGFNNSSAKYSVSGGEVTSARDSYGSEHSSDGEIYYFATGLGYKNLKEFDDAVSRGFRKDKAEDYRFAVNKGLKDRTDYLRYNKFVESMEGAGFKDEKEYARVLNLGLQRKDAYDDYLFLKRIQSECSFETIQEAHLFTILSRKDLGREKNLSDILETLQREQPNNWDRQERYEEMYNEEKGSFESINFGSGRGNPEWYGEKFKEINGVEGFLSNDPSVRRIGIYYPDRKAFVSFSDKTILIDGSNVAFNNADKAKGGKPYAQNIKLVVDEIRKTGFTDVKVFHDANLPYIVEDKTVFGQLKGEGVLRQIPAGTQADDFIIKYAKEYRAHIVTNDTFKDWAEKDPWVAANVRDFRIGFMIEDNVVKFSTNYDKIDLSTFTGIDVSGFTGFKSMYSVGRKPETTIFEKQARYTAF